MTLRTLVRALPVAAIIACNPTEVIYLENCQVDVELTNITGTVGEPATIEGGPFTRLADTRVVVGGADATVTDVSKTGCLECSSCREANEDCDECGACEACETFCAECVESVTFIVPALATGEHAVLVFNEHGTSQAATLTILAGDSTVMDTGPNDTAPTDTAPPETGDTALHTGSDTATP